MRMHKRNETFHGVYVRCSQREEQPLVHGVLCGGRMGSPHEGGQAPGESAGEADAG